MMGLLTFSNGVFAQNDTLPAPSVDPALMSIFNAKYPRKYIIADIAVKGNKAFDPAIVISVSGLAVGDEVTLPGGDNFAKAINKLWSQNMFTNINIWITKLEENNIWVEIDAVERPMLADYKFKGIRKTESDELKDKVGLVKSRVVTDNMKLSAKENIIKYYTEKGFRGAAVEIEEKPDAYSPDKTVLTFNIVKGLKVRISEVFFFGNQSAAIPSLKRKLKGTKEMTRITLYPDSAVSPYGPIKTYTAKEFIKNWGFLKPSQIRDFMDPWFRFKLFASAKFDEKKYLEDKEKILQYYNSLGYRDAVIASDTQYYDKKGKLNISMKVEEGSKYYFGNMTWKGNTKYADSILNMVLGIKKGDTYNIDILNKKLGKQLSPEGGDVSSIYMDDGYLFFSVNPIETSVYSDTIDHELRITEGPQATIKNVNISGNDKTKEHVIRRELRTVPGEKFSRSDLIRSQREILNLGYFNQEKLGMQPVPNQEDGTVDINYTVEEKSSDQLELSAGWGGNIGLTGTLGVTFNNFSIKNIWKKTAWDPLPTGDGQKLSIRYQSNGRYFRSVNFSFTEPWFGGKKRNSFTFNVFNTKFTNAYNPFTFRYDRTFVDSSYLSTSGATIAFGKQLKWPDDFFSLVTSLNYIQYRAKNYAIFPSFSTGISNNINLKLALQRTSIDQPIFPRSGSNFLASAAFTPPWSYITGVNQKDIFRLVEYHKWRFNAEWFVPIGKPAGEDKSRQFVLRMAAKYGFIGRYNKNIPISPFERFQVGDAGITNNFGVLGYDLVAHRGYPVYDNSDPTVNPDKTAASQFFTIFNKYSMEMRYPFVTNPSSTIYGLAFYEAANGWFSFKEWNPFRLRRSVGLGVRFFLPMFGLLGFDYGVGLDRLTPNGRLRDASRFTFMLGFEPE
ncbi:MAG: outer membrane protein assembly factor [Bacteroidota bacterium]|jgi:outer membrane protein insertion porin family|nr:outer membrane protein assembly factor [Chitinophagaceae bacterium]